MRGLLIASRTNKGLVRENNEDSILVKPPKLFVIADGMGGHLGGETASSTATAFLSKVDFTGVPEKELLAFLDGCFQNISRKIWQMAQDDVNLQRMGTTLTAVYLVDDERACVAHVGDSRIYLLQTNGLKKITSDHSYVAELVRNKEITPQEAASHQHRNIIMRAVGVEPGVETDLFEFLTVGAKRLLLSSDGLTNMVSEKEIESILQTLELPAAADALMERALAAGGTDNISFIILDLED
ncbi:MAG: Stp1/IreP family PP2C-type Ser/Thr phosphatase [Acidaminococcaceae bacterium]|nr:Stp1/IreP family PP2C-type Ser/Thr phosphatase [Acidaminococcaceae bacterium]